MSPLGLRGRDTVRSPRRPRWGHRRYAQRPRRHGSAGRGNCVLSQSITHRAPAYVGDTLTARAEVISLKPDKPVCELPFEIVNQDEKVLLEADAWTYTLRPDLEDLRGS